MSILNNNTELSDVKCTLLVKFNSQDDHIYKFDETWNINIKEFSLCTVNELNLKIEFLFKAILKSKDPDGKTIITLAHENLDELQPYLEKLEILLDIISFQVGVPLVIVEGSFEFNGAGYISKSNPVTNTVKLKDTEGLLKRYDFILGQEKVSNALRFFRLAQIYEEMSVKSVLLWATIEALFKGYKKNCNTIWSNLTITQQKDIMSTFNGLSIDSNKKDQLIAAVKERKMLSNSELLSTKIKLMNSQGDYSTEQIVKLVQWWANSRHNPAHGERIRKNDEYMTSAIEDLEDTLETLLESEVYPQFQGYFIGNPNDMDNNFWDKSNYMINKKSNSCWIMPSQITLEYNHQILKDIAHHKINSNSPLLFVTHNKVFDLSPESVNEIRDSSTIPDEFASAVQIIKEKINKHTVIREV